jgi:hypothetical protein
LAKSRNKAVSNYKNLGSLFDPTLTSRMPLLLPPVFQEKRNPKTDWFDQAPHKERSRELKRKSSLFPFATYVLIDQIH